VPAVSFTASAGRFVLRHTFPVIVVATIADPARGEGV
jgi:hypothetical protein